MRGCDLAVKNPSCLCGLRQPALHRGERQNMLLNYNNNDVLQILLEIDVF